MKKHVINIYKYMSDIVHLWLVKLMSRPQLGSYLVWIIFFLLASNVVLYTYFNARPYVQADGWRFIDIYLIPWNEGRLELADLFIDHHPAPITAALFIINAELFGLRMDYEAMLGVLFIVLISFIFIREMEKRNLSRLGIITTTVIMMSLVSVNVYIWSLVAVSYYIPGLFGLLAIFYIDKIAKNRIKLRDLSMLTVALTLFVLMFGDSAKLILVPILGVFLLAAILERKMEYLKLVVVIVIAILLHSQALDILAVNDKYSEGIIQGNLFGNIFTYFEEFLRYIGIAFMSSWGNIAYHTRYFELSEYVIEIAGLIVLMIYLVTTYLYYQLRIYEKTKVPIILIAIAVVTAISGWLFRYNPELQQPISGNIPRYYMMYSFGLVGVIWTWTEYLKENTSNVRFIVNGFIVILIGSHMVAMNNEWHESKKLRKRIVKVSEIMVSHGNGDYAKTVPMHLIGFNPERYKRGIKYLKDKKFNVFNDNDLIQKYRR